jgi:hypothetical protein
MYSWILWRFLFAMQPPAVAMDAIGLLLLLKAALARLASVPRVATKQPGRAGTYEQVDIDSLNLF